MRHLRRLLPYLARHRARLLGGTACLLVTTALSVASPWVLRHAIDAGQPWPYAQPTWVFSTRTLRAIPGADVRFVQGDVRPVHAAMVQAAAGRNLWIVGGGELVGQFYDAGLLDELIVQVAPVTLGAGKPLLPRRIDAPALQLQSAGTLGGVFAELRFAVPPPARGGGNI